MANSLIRTYLAVLALPGCIAAGSLSGAVAQPAQNWVLERVQDIGAMPKRPTLKEEGEKLSGWTGCNTFTATIARLPTADERIKVENVTATRSLCGPGDDRIEAAVLQALSDTAYVRRDGKKLSFLSAAKRPLMVWASPESKSALAPPSPAVGLRKAAPVRAIRASVAKRKVMSAKLRRPLQRPRQIPLRDFCRWH